MSLKTVLAPLLGNEADAAILSAALAIAKPHGAHIFAAHIHRDPRDVLVPQVGMGMSASMIEALVEQAQKNAEESQAASRKAYDAWKQKNGVNEVTEPSGAAGVTTSWEVIVSEPGSAVARRGRLVDVVCVVTPTDREGSDALSVAEAAIMETGKATLLVPQDVTMTTVTGVAVGWNASKEAACAVAHAMPLMETAEKVLVLAGTDEDLTEAAVKVFVDSLRWHGVKATGRTFPASSGSVSGRLQAEAREAGVHVLVLGAYSHSRFREFVFGGVTDDILTETRIPVLLAH